MLRSLHMKDVGPAARLDLELGERLNLLTGDNGLGKSCHIVPALLRVLSDLTPDMKAQLIVTTHSPMVMASIEPHFDERRDKLFLFELHRDEVSLREVP